MKKTIIVLAVLALAGQTALQAQQQDEYNESVVVKGTYRPVIEQAEKLTFPAQIADTLPRMEQTFHYAITPTRLRTHYQPAPIRAARLKGEPATRLYNNYLRLGFGNYWSPLADLYWSSTRDRLKTYGVRINHLSSWGSIDEYGSNHFGNTGITLFGKYIVKEKLQLSSDIGYEHDHNLYYGGLPDSDMLVVYGLSRDDMPISDRRASYNLVSWNLGLRNMQLDPNRLGYTARVHLADLWTLYGQNEFNLNLEADVHYGFSIGNRYKGVAYLHAEWDAYNMVYRTPDQFPYGYLSNSLPVDRDEFRHIVKVNPYADFMLGGWQLHTGLTLGGDRYTDTAAVFRLFPDVVATKKLMNERLVLSLGATGGFDANSLNTLRQTNPYLAPLADLRATRHYDFTLHGRWTFSRKLEANAEVQYSLLRDDLSFAPSTAYSPLTLFEAAYLDDNRLTAGGDIAFVNDEMITLRAGGHYYRYTAVDATTLLSYRPSWDALLAADVNYLDRWLVHLEGRLLGRMLTSDGSQLPMRYGIAAQVEYRHNKALSFFLRMDNLAFQRYWLWETYPSQRALFLAGLTYTIPHK